MVPEMSLLCAPENRLREVCPPYEAKLEVLGEKATQLRLILSMTVVFPRVTLIVRVVPWRLVGETDT